MFTEEEKLKIINQHLSTLSPGPYVEDNSSLSRGPPPVRVELTTDVGRQLVASRDIKAGEVLFIEAPFVPAIPRPEAVPVCMSCLMTLPEKDYNCCSGCGVPLCSEACEAKRHSHEECCLLTKIGWNNEKESPISLQELNLLMTPLRTLVYLATHPDMTKILLTLTDGEKSRAKFNSAALERHKKIAAVIYSRISWDLENLEEKSFKILGIFDTNGFDVPFSSDTEDQDTWGRAIFPATSMMNHSCVPNTHNTFTATDKTMLILASQNIPKGAPICISYSKSKVMFGNRMRREYLEYKWFFTCNCARCIDPTELGSHIGSVKCKHCKDLAVPNDSGYNTLYTCNTCHKNVSSKTVDAALALLATSFAKVRKSNVKGLRRAAIITDKILGPQIFLSVTFKHQTVKTIMKKHTADCSLSDLWYVIDVTSSLIDVAANLAPGMSYLRGDMLYKHIRAALEILLRAKKDKTETVSTINDYNNVNGNIADKQKSQISHSDDIGGESAMQNLSGNDPSKVGNSYISLLPVDSKSLNDEDQLKLRWKELDIKDLLEWTKEAQEIMKYTFYGKDIFRDTNDAIECFQELLQS